MQSENTHGAKQEVTIGREAEHTAIISEENNDPGQKEINRFADELAKEIADLQLRHTELSNKLLSMKENILNLQKQNNDLETKQSKISALMKFKHKLADDKGRSICVASPWNIKVGQDSSKTNIDFNSKHTDQISQKGTEFEKYSMKAFNVIENKHCESFSIYL